MFSALSLKEKKLTRIPKYPKACSVRRMYSMVWRADMGETYKMRLSPEMGKGSRGSGGQSVMGVAESVSFDGACWGEMITVPM